jgi:hypothetical protein
MKETKRLGKRELRKGHPSAETVEKLVMQCATTKIK